MALRRYAFVRQGLKTSAGILLEEAPSSSSSRFIDDRNRRCREHAVERGVAKSETSTSQPWRMMNSLKALLDGRETHS